MLRLVPLLLLATGVLGGDLLSSVSVRMPYLNPAGVTYTSSPAVSYALPAPAVQYSGAALHAGHVVQHAGPVVHHAAPIVHHAAPVVHHAAPAVQFAAAPVHSAVQYAATTLPAVRYGHALSYAAPPVLHHHVPVEAHVPVTKIGAEPGILRSVVDVAHPKVATRRFQVRRPAIQKQFYTVEERTVIRPIGSALVELSEPVSKTQSGPTVVSPAVHVPAGPAIHVPAITAPPPGSFPQEPPSQQQFPQPPQQPQFPPQQPQFPSQQPQFPPQQPQFPSQQPQFPSQQPQFPSQQPQFPPQQPQFPSQQPQFPSQQPQQPEFDDSDSVSVSNPDIARTRTSQIETTSVQPSTEPTRTTQPIPQTTQGAQFRFSQEQSSTRFPQDLTIPQIRTSQFTLPQFRIPQFPQLYSRIQYPQPFIGFPTFQTRAFSGFQNSLDSRTSLQNSRMQEVEEPRLRSQFSEEQAQQRNQFSGEQAQQRSQFPVEQAQQRSQFSAEQAQQRSQFSGEQAQQRSQLSGEQAQQRFQFSEQQVQQRNQFSAEQRTPEGPSAEDALRTPLTRSRTSTETGDLVPSFRNLSPEAARSNQERLIELLTGDGGATEVRSTADLGRLDVRARVLSVTPAPDTKSADERVVTRRIVVSRPVQTLQEVEVAEPFTKLERVAVDRPALLKTARVGVARVPLAQHLAPIAPIAPLAPIAPVAPLSLYH